MMNEFRLVDSYPNVKEIVISREQELKNTLLQIKKVGNQVVVLKSPESGELTVGVGDPYGFVEYNNALGEPPYLIAVDKNNPKPDEYYEFDSGGTPTPIPSDYCLPFDRILNIVIYFFNHMALPVDIEWQEV